MRFTIKILGCSAAFPRPGRHSSSFLLNIHEQYYMIDCGEATQMQLVRYGINLNKINHIFISHIHGDHCYGLFGLISTMSLMGRERELNIYGPKPIKDIIDFHLKYFDNKLNYSINCHEIDSEDVIYENKVLTVETIKMKHKIPTFGFIFREKQPAINVIKDKIDEYGLSLTQVVELKRGNDVIMQNGEVARNEEFTYIPYSPRSFAYCSDTSYSKYYINKIHNVDLLYHEATFLEKDEKLAYSTGHSTALSAARAANEAEVGRLIIGHLSCRYKDNDALFLNEAQSLFKNTSLAEEGNEEVINIKKQYK